MWHVQVLNGIGRELEVKAPAQGDMKQTFTSCKIAFGDMLGNAAWRHENKRGATRLPPASGQSGRDPGVV